MNLRTCGAVVGGLALWMAGCTSDAAQDEASAELELSSAEEGPPQLLKDQSADSLLTSISKERAQLVRDMLAYDGPMHEPISAYEDIADEEVIRLAEQLGFAREKIELDGDVVRVEEDIVLMRGNLVNGEYHARQPESDAAVTKGYRSPGTISSAVVPNLKVAFDASLFVAAYTPNPAMAMAIFWLQAAGNVLNDYNVVANSKLNMQIIAVADPKHVTVHLVPNHFWASTPCQSNSFGCAGFPSNGQPSPHVYLRADLNSSLCPSGWTSNYAQAVMVHELGHMLGLTHPGTLNGTHIGGTASCTALSPSTCTGFPGYNTVMATGVSPCNTTRITLQADDRLAISKLY